MAREVHPAAPPDPVEILKRKYLRQNKDIARINASQAIRIRSLESEISRLLTENLSLRSQIISQDSAPQRNRDFIEHVGVVREELEGKLREVAALVAGLSRPVKPVRKSGMGVGGEKKAKRRTEEERRMLMESLECQEGRLPKIHEDREYTGRETMDQEELAAAILQATSGDHDLNDSPDVGPPPISHLIDEEPIKLSLDFSNPSSKATSVSPPNVSENENEAEEPILSINLEQRRKRRDPSTSTSTSSRRDSAFVSELKSLGTATGVSKPPKRKLMVADDLAPEREARAVAISPADDFKYTRRTTSSEPASSNPTPNISQSESESEKAATTTKATKKLDEPAEAPPIQPLPAKTPRRTTRPALTADTPILPPPSSTGLSSRRALGPKQSNFDVANSPKKRAARNLDVKDKGLAPKITELDVGVGVGKERRSRSRTPVVPVDEIVVSCAEVEVDVEAQAPKPPVVKAVEKVRKQVVRAETPPPPPPAPATSVRDTSSEREGARPSRRARASVSYAEPNLRDKMRRPGKELVDAIVITGEKTIRRESTSVEPQSVVKIKSEPVDDEGWKSEAIPLSVEAKGTEPVVVESQETQSTQASEGSQESKDGESQEVATQVIEEYRLPIPEPPARRRRTIQPDETTSTSTATTTKPLAIPSGRKTPRELKPLAQKIPKDKDVYDFDTSSSEKSMTGVSNTASGTGRVLKPSARLIRSGAGTGAGTGGESGEEGKTSSRLTTARRRQSALAGVGGGGGGGEGEKVGLGGGLGGGVGERRAGGLVRSGSAMGLNAASGGGGAAEPGVEGRTTSRRRSMMI